MVSKIAYSAVIGCISSEETAVSEEILREILYPRFHTKLRHLSRLLMLGFIHY